MRHALRFLLSEWCVQLTQNIKLANANKCAQCMKIWKKTRECEKCVDNRGKNRYYINWLAKANNQKFAYALADANRNTI